MSYSGQRSAPTYRTDVGSSIRAFGSCCEVMTLPATWRSGEFVWAASGAQKSVRAKICLKRPSGSQVRRVARTLGALVLAFAEIFQYTIAGAHGEGDDGHGGRLVRLRRENARVADV